MRKLSPALAKYLGNAAWIAAFVALCAGWIFAVVRTNYPSPETGAASNEVWVCPIAGQCGPPGTPGLGKW
jgi:hypothetical protein